MARRVTFEHVMSALFALSAVTVAGVVVSREFRRPPTAPPAAAPEQPVYMIGWENEVPHGLHLGADSAPVTIMEFMDFQCPFCRRHAARMDTLLDEFPDDVRLVVQHLPLRRIHRFAQISAVAAECAAGQGRLRPFSSVLFQKQDSIGLKDWGALADEAGIPDTEAFRRCVEENESFPRIDYGRALAERAGITATPTVLINGWKLPHPPDLDELRRSVRAVLGGDPPFSGDSARIPPPSGVGDADMIG